MLNRRDEDALTTRQKEIRRKIHLLRKNLSNNPDRRKELKLLMREHREIAQKLSEDIKICQACGIEISKERVRALKKTKTPPELCVFCAKEQEKRQKLFGLIPSHNGYGCESRL